MKSGERKETHLCEDCARKLNLPYKSQALSLNELLGALMDKGQKKSKAVDKKNVCPECGISLAEFKSTGRFGCPHDYTVFRQHVDKLLKKVHGATRYIGQLPRGRVSVPVYENELTKLQDKLQKVIKAEEYEEAATIRDRILELEELITHSREQSGGVDG
jgi:protein arginine kinase activator